MRSAIAVALLALIGCGLIELAPAREVTNEEIREGMLSLVNSYSLLDNKLERHEHRERALGELIKRALQSLQKGQKSFEPMNGIFTRLDERVSQIETLLMAQEDRHNIQTDKLGEALEQIFKWMQTNNECFNQRLAAPPAVVPAAATVIPDNSKLTGQVEKLSKDVAALVQTSQSLLAQTEKLIKTKEASTDAVISKIEDKFTSLYLAAPSTTPIPPKDTSQFENSVSESLRQINKNLYALQNEVPKVADKLTDLDKTFIQTISNETLNAIEDLKIDLLTASDKALNKVTSRIKETNENLAVSVTDVGKSVTESTELADKFYTDVNSTYSNLLEKLDIFDKFNKVLLANSDYVLDTQRKVEFGTHQVIQKVGELIRTQNTDLNSALQKRFDDVDSSIVNNNAIALQNLSSTMESEISHVWRQIEIMHSEISYSKDALNKLQGQTEVYVNGTLTTMDSMEGKVSKITSRMSEVDENLNFLLGRLSLVTQEFNKIKSGLTSALDEIRSSFQTVQEKIAPGPGPHAIPQNEYETDINLLSKRNAQEA